MWCIGEVNSEYLEKMEDVLDAYKKPVNPKEPVICLDEKPVQLLKEVKPPSSAQPGMISKQDYEYIRKGTANVYCLIEPKAGKHFSKVTPNRKKPEFAKLILEITKKYPKAKTIHLVMDNLNIHCKTTLTDIYGEKKGTKIWNRFTIHHTPKHGSWLNQAEIAISMLSRQCLGKDRLADLNSLKKRVGAWTRRLNRKRLVIKWRFTSAKARKVFHYKRLTFKRPDD